jgi:hypothetical protein
VHLQLTMVPKRLGQTDSIVLKVHIQASLLIFVLALHSNLTSLASSKKTSPSNKDDEKSAWSIL